MALSDACYYLVIAVVFLALLRFKNYFRAVRLALVTPGPAPIPLLGNVLLVANSKKLQNLANKITELYGPVTRFWVSFLPVFLVVEPKHLQLIISSNKVSCKNMFYTFMHNFLGEGLITNNGDKWKKNRKLIQPHFHVNALKTFLDTFSKHSETLVNRLKNESDVKITRFINDCVLDILHDATLGVTLENNESTPFRKGQVLMTYRVTRPWLLVDSIFKLSALARTELQQKQKLQDYTRKILEARRTEYHDHNKSLMDIMIEISKSNPEFTDEDIINESCTFMLAGQDSVGAATAFALYFLAKHEDVQERVVEELNAIFSGSDRKVTFEDLNEMKYLEQCIKEAMRLCPSVPMIARKLREDVSLGKVVLPAGSNILVSPFTTHRLPHIFPDPLTFNPERFSAENQTKIHPYAYIPFSAGQRICIGNKFGMFEMKVMISDILRNYQLSLTPGHEEINLSYRVTLRASKGIWLRLKQRNNVTSIN